MILKFHLPSIYPSQTSSELSQWLIFDRLEFCLRFLTILSLWKRHYGTERDHKEEIRNHLGGRVSTRGTQEIHKLSCFDSEVQGRTNCLATQDPSFCLPKRERKTQEGKLKKRCPWIATPKEDDTSCPIPFFKIIGKTRWWRNIYRSHRTCHKASRDGCSPGTSQFLSFFQGSILLPGQGIPLTTSSVWATEFSQTHQITSKSFSLGI